MSASIDAIREQMISQQVRTWEVFDPAVLDVLNRTPRERFVGEHYRSLAFADANIPIKPGRVALTPKVEGRILQALTLTAHDQALEIGTGSGYLTACMARMAAHVTSIDSDPELVERAQKRLAELGIHNCRLVVRDPFDSDAPEFAEEYDAIAVTGSLPVDDPRLRHSLKLGGRLFVVVGHAPVMEAKLITRTGKNEWTAQSLFETVIPRLPTVTQPREFIF